MKHYSTNAKTNDNTIHIWRINNYGEVFLRKFNIYKKTLRVDELTIVTNDFEYAVQFAKCKWNAYPEKVEIEKVYEFESESEQKCVVGYVMIENSDENCGSEEGKFVSFHHLDDCFKRFQLDIDFKEAFYGLLAYLDKKYGYHKVSAII